jgi:hypothetical protein
VMTEQTLGARKRNRLGRSGCLGGDFYPRLLRTAFAVDGADSPAPAPRRKSIDD